MNLQPYNVDAVLKNIESVFKNKSIDKLRKPAYQFIMLMSGFIAHYDLSGFKSAYSDLRDLINDIISTLPIERDCAIRDINDVEGGYNGYGLPYCQSKLEIINGLERIVSDWKLEIEDEFKRLEKVEIQNEISRLQNQLASI